VAVDKPAKLIRYASRLDGLSCAITRLAPDAWLNVTLRQLNVAAADALQHYDKLALHQRSTPSCSIANTAVNLDIDAKLECTVVRGCGLP
jgi:hypothetical protein